MAPKLLRIGTRASQLALWQANWIKSELEREYPGIVVELIKIKTTGDKILDVPLAQVGGKGLFVKEIEEAMLRGEIDLVWTPSNSGKGQKIARCPTCRVAVWSHYAGAGERVSFVRVGTLDEPSRWPPDIHIFTASKQPWVVLPEGVPVVAEYYEREEYWPAESLARRERLLSRIEASQAAGKGGG